MRQAKADIRRQFAVEVKASGTYPPSPYQISAFDMLIVSACLYLLIRAEPSITALMLVDISHCCHMSAMNIDANQDNPSRCRHKGKTGLGRQGI
jgi:hypothetical protein